MIYRNANKNDVAAIANLHAESWRSTYRGMMSDAYLDGDVFEERFKHWKARFDLPKDNQYIIVAIENDKLVGFACVFGDDDAKWGSLIDNLHVRPDLKRQGIGKYLIQKAMSWVHEHYPEKGVYLWVFEDNIASRRFYEAIGGINVEKIWHPNEDGTAAYALRYAW